MQRLSSIYRAQWSLVLVALLSFVSASAEASTICEAGCSDDGGTLGFEASLRPDDGASLKIRTAGTIYVLGRFTTDGGDIRMRAENDLIISIPDLDLSGSNIFLTGENNVDIQTPGVSDPPIGVLPPRGGDSTISIDGGDITLASLDGGYEELTALPVTLTSFVAEQDTECLNFQGDVFLDLTGLTLADLDIAAGQDIIWSLEDPYVVPEPGTALLMGLGLTLLGARRGTRTA